MKGFTFRGRHTDEFGLIVNSVSRTMMPPLEAKSITIPNRPGAHYFGSETGIRTFTVIVTLPIQNTDWVWDVSHDISTWLTDNENEEAELIFDHEPDVRYYAFVTGETPLEKAYTHAASSITFVCPDPFGYGPEYNTGVIPTSPANVNISGYEPTYPVYSAKFTEDSTYFTLATKDEHIHIGAPAGVDEVRVPKQSTKFNDEMASTKGWVNHATIENGTPSGSFKSIGYAFEAESFGTGAEWHGPCVKRVLNTPIQNFKMETRVQFSSWYQNEVGRIDIYMLDINGNIIGRIGLRDAWGSERTTVEARAGGLYGGHKFLHFVGDMKTKKRKVVTKKKVKGKEVNVTSYVNDGFSTYSDFYGILRLQRVGKQWTAHSGKIDKVTGRHHARKTTSWTDKTNAYSDKVAGVAIHIGQHASKPTVRSMRFYQVALYEINTITSEEIPVIIEAGDVITVDSEVGAVLKNGEPFLEDLHISSKFFPLYPGTNNIAFAPADKCDLEVYHRGRYK